MFFHPQVWQRREDVRVKDADVQVGGPRKELRLHVPGGIHRNENSLHLRHKDQPLLLQPVPERCDVRGEGERVRLPVP